MCGLTGKTFKLEMSGNSSVSKQVFSMLYSSQAEVNIMKWTALISVLLINAFLCLACTARSPKGAGMVTTQRSISTQKLAHNALPPSVTVTQTSSLSSAASPTPSKTSPPSTATPTSSLVYAPTMLPSSNLLVTNGSRDLPYIALTFDMCQKPEYPAWFDEGIYQALIDADAPATFFMGGDWMRTHPDETLLLAANPNFELGNHSWSHPDLRDIAADEINMEIIKTQEILQALTGRQNQLFRLPGGAYNNLVLSQITALDMYTIQWDVITADPVPDNSAENIQKIVRQEVRNGSIIIMHANGRGWHTAEALPGMIQELREAGFILVTVSQLIGLQPIYGGFDVSDP
jgi:peptidoglycan/xylan/chitin deacetylase (PgdA/CDA1 family)